jgi:predicted Zn-dependent peptidase
MTPEITRLDSGLTVITCPMPGIETVAVAIHTAAGARHETEATNGLAHLFEHMVFKGTERRSARAIAEAAEDAGAQLNAWTARDMTVFHARLLARDLPLGVDLLSDMVLNARFDETDLAKEKDVVLSELGEARDTPDDIVFDYLQEAAFPGQALGRSILGSEESLARLGVEDLRAWQRAHYKPERLVLVAAGKVDHADLVRLGEQAFRPDVHGPPQSIELARFAPGEHRDDRRVEQAQLTMAWPGPSHHDPDHDAAALFALAAGGGMSSRLFQELREERGLAYSVSATMTPYADGGMITVHAAAARRDAARARDLIGKVMAETAATLDSAELGRARAQAVAGLLMALESPQGQADYAARQQIVHGRFVPPAEVVARIEAVTVDDVRAAGRAILSHAPARAEIGTAAARKAA